MKGKILMVDDNPKNLQVLGNVLKSNDYAIEFATSGKGALKWLESDSFDLILLDIMMPEMDGYEVATYIRKNPELDDMPIVFLTAKVDSESIVKGFETGGQDYVSKPFESRELLARIKTQIDLKHSKTSLQALNKELEQKVLDRTHELEESRKKYQYALEASKDGIWDWNLETDTMEFSEGLYKMLEFNSDEFPQTRIAVNNLMHPDDLKDRNETGYLENYRKNSNDFIEEEVRMQTKSGNYIWVRIHGKVVERNSEGLINRIIGTHSDITDEKRKNLDILTAVLETEDRERTRISQDIHDGLHQTLTLSAMNFSSAKKSFNNGQKEFVNKFEEGWDYLQQGIVESRLVAQTLMPKAIVDFGLVSATESLIGELNMNSESTQYKFYHNFEDTRLGNHQVELILYRILQEALNNVVRYAEANNVTVQIKNYEDLVMLTVEDDGKGFDPLKIKDDNKGFGLKSMKDRLKAVYGNLEIESQPERGTTVIVQIEKNKILNL